MTPRFRHTEPGHSEASWLSDPRWETRPVVDLVALVAAHPRALVLSAHPDDETLGAGALISALARLGAAITVLVATAGEHSHPEATAWTPTHLARQRRDEVRRAVADLDPRAVVDHLGLPDGGLASREEFLVTRIAGSSTPDTLIVAPWIDDGHPDHDALGRAARSAALRVGCRVVHYPIWLWHWCPPPEAPWKRFRIIEPQVVDLQRKRRALERFGSQADPLGPCPGDRPVLTDAMLARAERLIEVLIDPGDPPAELPYAGSTAAERTAELDGMYDRTDDPWDFGDSFYEHRKRSLTLAMLGRRHYPQVLEVGCATGQLTRALAGRAGHITALDTSARALAAARRQLPADGESITWLHGHAPGDLPAGPFDLVVVSEVGYFLTPLEWLATLRRVSCALTEGGELVLVHWRHPTRGIPLNGELAQAQAHHALALPHRAGYLDPDLRIDVWGSPLSVAQAEGRR